MNAETLLVDMKTGARILGIPFTAVRRLIAEDRIPATRTGRGGKFFIARTALVKFVERIKSWLGGRGSRQGHR
jgi:excisionase family DNA binding protein